MKIVKFKDGKYAIRRFSIFEMRYVYYDITTYGAFWWNTSNKWIENCKTDSLEIVTKILNDITDKGTPI